MQFPTLIAVILAFAPHALAKTIVIDMPDLCTHVEKVVGNRVDLVKAKEPCPTEGPGKASVRMDENTKEINVYVNGTYWRRFSTNSSSLSFGNIADVVEGAKKYGEKLSIPENQHNTEALRLAEDLSRYVQSNEFQERIASEKTRLYREVYGSRTGASQEASKVPGKIGRLSPHERIYLFISSSVPIHTLRHYVRTLSALGEPNVRIVMRGFIDGARFVNPTVTFLKDILFVDPECDPGKERCSAHRAQLIIDPLLFRRYHIERVPTFVYVPSITVTDMQASEGLESNGTISDHYLVHGDVSLEYALNLFLGQWKSPGLEGLLTACQGE